jgi:hypothetical protein
MRFEARDIFEGRTVAGEWNRRESSAGNAKGSPTAGDGGRLEGSVGIILVVTNSFVLIVEERSSIQQGCGFANMETNKFVTTRIILAFS